ncbi:serine protease inhibitor dipetalogastin-like [Phlebotomus papatasi]|uniref:serine protease inhibitor dipetalogastin-like n=1 Tax=Phlebotomus papatasi TaxID=29031 RepID=UPI00248462EC|nr:serine protease inhibitor dipetalogastin-like [Phlebotomus papatasi]XP_055706460.1 serine protease inhibitor dipetalogastin-like [Phlebotomus papatasi]XP_055706469.1 serine protease inhibitor dipetalogastin-like [Phlebotomus papatasi]XP_055706480.1 serine protease inhibitor dipetalogastin-like [Phlebotomus papatasi]
MKMNQLNSVRNLVAFALVSYLVSHTVVTAAKCNLNPFYKPICGSDGKTYGNIDMLNCINIHRPFHRRIHVVRKGECAALLCPSYEDLQGPWTSDTIVCANNGYSYGHPHQVRCLKAFIPTINIVHEGGCTIREVRKSLHRQFRMKACKLPRRRFEKNVVCGHNNKTYDNPFEALCTKPRIHEKLGGKCFCPFQMSCEFATLINRSFFNATRAEKERYIVCGSDRRTYRSHHHLECSRRLDRYLYRVSNGACKEDKDPCPQWLKFIKTPTPVCGSDKRSYVSYEALLCAAARLRRNLIYVHSGPCIE